MISFVTWRENLYDSKVHLHKSIYVNTKNVLSYEPNVCIYITYFTSHHTSMLH